MIRGCPNGYCCCCRRRCRRRRRRRRSCCYFYLLIHTLIFFLAKEWGWCMIIFGNESNHLNLHLVFICKQQKYIISTQMWQYLNTHQHHQHRSIYLQSQETHCIIIHLASDSINKYSGKGLFAFRTFKICKFTGVLFCYNRK